jgi:hypothetical protein
MEQQQQQQQQQQLQQQTSGTHHSKLHVLHVTLTTQPQLQI